jgi:3-deoxy-D-manno-octulosonic-acid transferase
MSTGAERDRQQQLWRYNLLLRLLALPIASYTLWQALRERDLRYLRERLGLYRETGGDHPIWLHAASVGEVNAALPLIESLSRHNPGIPLLLTTTTPSGARTAAVKLPGGVRHVYFPVDWHGAVRRFLARHRPRCALVMETELWPNLYSVCNAEGIPLLIVNGRLSARTRRARPWLRRLYGLCLQQVSAVLARSEHDRLGFIQLGAPRDRCEAIGNIKFAAAPSAGGINPIELGFPYVLAASTREGEEKLLSEAWRQSGAAPLLVIVPRHPRRLAQILADLRGKAISVRSRNEAITDTTRIYLADTFGELPGFIAGAELVFMGGSLVPKGGQNLLEAAALGKAPLFGPHMENFLCEAEVLLSHGGAVQARDAKQLAFEFSRLLEDEALRVQMGEKARAVVDERRDMAERYREAISRYCGHLE